MVPSELEEFLDKVINSSLNKSIMIWGAPGIGKSSIVQSLAIKLNLQFIDLRLSQLAPTDLRGLPVPFTLQMKRKELLNGINLNFYLKVAEEFYFLMK